MHFRGVVFSDDLEMKAISDRYGAEDAAVEAIEAGADCLLFCEHLDRAVAAIEVLEQATRRSARLRERIEDASSRIGELRRGHLRKVRRPHPDPAALPEIFAKHRNLVTWISERSTQGRGQMRA
jgi:beta-N-acetylhexosaminidase